MGHLIWVNLILLFTSQFCEVDFVVLIVFTTLNLCFLYVYIKVRIQNFLSLRVRNDKLIDLVLKFEFVVLQVIYNSSVQLDVYEDRVNFFKKTEHFIDSESIEIEV